jgi:hypothetical protein
MTNAKVMISAEAAPAATMDTGSPFSLGSGVGASVETAGGIESCAPKPSAAPGAFAFGWDPEVWLESGEGGPA